MIKHVHFHERGFCHSPPLKRIINSFLRYIQKGSDSPLLIASEFEIKNGKPVRLIGYALKRIRME